MPRPGPTRRSLRRADGSTHPVDSATGTRDLSASMNAWAPAIARTGVCPDSVKASSSVTKRATSASISADSGRRP
jgi:hypothetical protein